MSFLPHHTTHGDPDRPLLILSNSLGTDERMWDAVVPTLSRHHHVLSYDSRGHGRSATPDGPYEISDLGQDVLALADAVRAKRFSFCGISIGGMTGLWLAANAPGRIDHLIVGCSSAFLPPAQAWHDRAKTVRDAGSTEPIADAVVSRWLTPEFASAHPETRDQLLDMIRAAPSAGYAATCEAIACMDLRADLARITAPTLVISALRDEAIPPAHSRAVAAGVRGARVAEIERAAHIPAVERPDTVSELILQHLNPRRVDVPRTP